MTIQTLVTKSNHNNNGNLSNQSSPTKYTDLHVQCQLFVADFNQNQKAMKNVSKKLHYIIS
jgi:hypothetical protein